MIERRKWAFLAVAALVVASSVVPASAAPYTPTTPNRFVSGWVPYWEWSTGSATLTGARSAPVISDLSVMGFDQNLVMLNSRVSTVVTNGRNAGLPVLPTIFGARTDVFSDANRAQHVQDIVDLVMARGYDGIDIDYEFVWSVPRSSWPALQTLWIAFVRELSGKLHANGKLLSVTVPPVWGSGASGYTVYAQPDIARYVDRLRLMVYDWSISSPGNIAPAWWVNQVISYSTDIAKVPPKKLQLGVPAYGRHWWTKKVSSETCPDGSLKSTDSVRMREVAGLLAGKAVTASTVNGEAQYTWDEKVTGLSKLPPVYTPVPRGITSITAPGARDALAPAVRLGVPRTVTCTIRHVVFVPTATTLLNSAKAALARGWSGIILWTFGYESSDVFTMLNESARIPQQRATGSRTVTPLVVTAPTATTVRVTGSAFHPHWDLPVAVRIEWQQGATVLPDAFTTLANANNGDTRVPSSLGPFHGFDITRPIPTGADSVCVTLLDWGGAKSAASRCAPIPGR